MGRRAIITCDGCGTVMEATREAEARAEACRKGWLLRQQDYCPECLRKARDEAYRQNRERLDVMQRSLQHAQRSIATMEAHKRGKCPPVRVSVEGADQ